MKFQKRAKSTHPTLQYSTCTQCTVHMTTKLFFFKYIFKTFGQRLMSKYMMFTKIKKCHNRDKYLSGVYNHYTLRWPDLLKISLNGKRMVWIYEKLKYCIWVYKSIHVAFAHVERSMCMLLSVDCWACLDKAPPPLYCLAVQCVREDWQISLKNLWLMTKRQSSMQQKRSKMIENLAPKKCICVKAHLILCSSSLNFVKKYMTFAIMLSCSQQNIKK